MAFETISLFDELENDDTQRRVASRRALALASTRVEQRLGSFLRGANSEEEFNARLALVEGDFNNYISSAAEEVGYDSPEHVHAAILDDYRQASVPKVSGPYIIRTNDGNESEEDELNAAHDTFDAQHANGLEPKLYSSSDEFGENRRLIRRPGQPRSSAVEFAPVDEGEEQEEDQDSRKTAALPLPGMLNNQGAEGTGAASVPPNAAGAAPATTPPVPNPAAAVNPQAGGAPGVQVPQGQEQQNQDQSLVGQMAQPLQQTNQLPAQTQPTMASVHKWAWEAGNPFADDYSYGRNAACYRCGREFPGSLLQGGLCPQCLAQVKEQQTHPQQPQVDPSQSVAPPNWVGSSVHTADDDDFSPADQNDDDGEGASVLDALSESYEPNHKKKSSFNWTVEASGNTDLGGPEPKIDKSKWTESNPGEPEEATKDSGRWPTKRKDIIEPIKAENRDQEGHEPKEIGEKTTEREKLPAAKGDDSGFADGGVNKGPHTKVFPKGDQVAPVTHESVSSIQFPDEATVRTAFSSLV